MPLVFREDDALIHGRDPDYRGIHEWWEKEFNRNFNADWEAAKSTEKDKGDCFSRMIIIGNQGFEVTQSFDGYSVRAIQ